MSPLLEPLGLNPKELAHLLGVSVKTIHRGTFKENSTAAVLAGIITARLSDGRSAQSIRALAMTAARGHGLSTFLGVLVEAYVSLDLLRIN